MPRAPLRQEDLLQQLAAESHRFLADYRSATAGLSVEQLNWKPGPKRWSIAEVFDHLVLQEKKYPPKIQRALEGAKVRKAGATYREGWLGGYLIRVVRPGGRPVPAPGILQPSQSHYTGAIVDEWFGLQDSFLGHLLEAQERRLDLQGVRIPWAVVGWVRFSLGDLFRMLVAHKQRHLEQIGRVRSAPGFPVN